MLALVSVCVKASPLFLVFPKTKASPEYKEFIIFFPDSSVLKTTVMF